MTNAMCVDHSGWDYADDLQSVLHGTLGYDEIKCDFSHKAPRDMRRADEIPGDSALTPLLVDQTRALNVVEKSFSISAFDLPSDDGDILDTSSAIRMAIRTHNSSARLIMILLSLVSASVLVSLTPYVKIQ